MSTRSTKPASDRYLTVEQLAQMLGVTRRTIQQRIKDRNVAVWKVSTKFFLVPVSSLPELQATPGKDVVA